jgi:hypothetical protein
MKRHTITEKAGVFDIDLPECMKDEYSMYVVTLKKQLNGFPHYGLLYKYSLLSKQLSLLIKYRYFYVYNAAIPILNIEQLFNFIANDNVLLKIYELYNGYLRRVTILIDEYRVKVAEKLEKLEVLVSQIKALESQANNELMDSYNITSIYQALGKLQEKYNLKTFNR